MQGASCCTWNNAAASLRLVKRSTTLLPLSVLLLLAPQGTPLVFLLLGPTTSHTLECSRLTQTT
jgi:hypothetical protein